MEDIICVRKGALRGRVGLVCIKCKEVYGNLVAVGGGPGFGIVDGNIIYVTFLLLGGGPGYCSGQ